MFVTERNNLVSVIISIYNYKYPENLRAVLKSIRNQNLDVEIVLSEQGFYKESIYKKISREFNTRYVLSKPDLVDGKEIYNTGRARNVGALISSGRYLYFNDADILIFSTNYLETIIKEASARNNYNWYRPSMYRLSESTSGEFREDYLAGKSINVLNLPDICLIDYNSTLLSTKSTSEGECNETILNQPFVCTKKEFDMFYSDSFDNENADELIWRARFHYGGTFCSFDNFINVAGYCELYYNYGAEDEDFHYKLKSKSGIGQIDSIVTKKSIIHFEHKMKINNQIFKCNANIYENRKNKGINEIINYDINNEKSFIGSYIKEDKNALRNFILDSL